MLDVHRLRILVAVALVFEHDDADAGRHRMTAAHVLDEPVYLVTAVDDDRPAGVGVSTLPGLALLAHRHPGVRIAPLPGDGRSVHALTFGAPPPPLAVQRFLDALRDGLAPTGWP